MISHLGLARWHLGTATCRTNSMAAVLFWSARFTVTVICFRKGSQLRMFILLSAMVPSPAW